MISVFRNRIDNNSWYDYYLTDGQNKLGIIFAGNGDLYFCSFDKSQESEFCITKENMIIYSLFDELFNDFKNVKVFNVDEIDLQFYDSSEEIKERYNRIEQLNENLKKSYIYKKIFDNNTITWISDESVSFDIESADALRIIKEDDKYKLKVTYYENENPFIRSIRIRNSGSRYNPFNIVMMNFFNKLQEYDPEYHQIHIEEYLYKNNNIKKLLKNKTF